MRKFFVGVDGGGTKTAAAVIDDKKRILVKTESGGSNPVILGYSRACKNLSQAVKKAVENLNLDQFFGCFCLAGVNFESDKKIWREAILKDQFLAKFTKPPLVLNDAVAALRAGTTAANAVVVISGTGSACYGRNEAGVEAKAGGLDYILSDEGSGYWIGTQILKSVTQALDGRGPTTALTNLVFDKFHFKSLEDLYQLVYLAPWGKIEIGQVAPLAEVAAKQEDAAAIEIVKKAAVDLAQMAKTAISKLALVDKKFDLVTAGSLLKPDQLIYQNFVQEVKSFAKFANFKAQEIKPAEAAALIAWENFH